MSRTDNINRRFRELTEKQVKKRFDKNGDLRIPGCETAVFRDRPSKGTREGIRQVVKEMLPIHVDFDTAIEELKDKPEKGKISIESIIDKYRIEQ